MKGRKSDEKEVGLNASALALLPCVDSTWPSQSVVTSDLCENTYASPVRKIGSGYPVKMTPYVSGPPDRFQRNCPVWHMICEGDVRGPVTNTMRIFPESFEETGHRDYAWQQSKGHQVSSINLHHLPS